MALSIVPSLNPELFIIIIIKIVNILLCFLADHRRQIKTQQQQTPNLLWEENIIMEPR